MADIGGGWIEHETDNGTKYYHHPVQGTHWELPKNDSLFTGDNNKNAINDLVGTAASFANLFKGIDQSNQKFSTDTLQQDEINDSYRLIKWLSPYFDITDDEFKQK